MKKLFSIVLLWVPLLFSACASVHEGPVNNSEQRPHCHNDRPTVSVETPTPSYIPQKPGTQRTPYTSEPSAYDAPGNAQPSPYNTPSGSNLRHDTPDQSAYSR